MNIAKEKRKALNINIDFQKTLFIYIFVYNSFCIMIFHSKYKIYKILFLYLLNTLKKADKKDSSLLDKIFVFLLEAGV